jgi:hypothetical protein
LTSSLVMRTVLNIEGLGVATQTLQQCR